MSGTSGSGSGGQTSGGSSGGDQGGEKGKQTDPKPDSPTESELDTGNPFYGKKYYGNRSECPLDPVSSTGFGIEDPTLGISGKLGLLCLDFGGQPPNHKPFTTGENIISGLAEHRKDSAVANDTSTSSGILGDSSEIASNPYSSSSTRPSVTSSHSMSSPIYDGLTAYPSTGSATSTLESPSTIGDPLTFEDYSRSSAGSTNMNSFDYLSKESSITGVGITSPDTYGDLSSSSYDPSSSYSYNDTSNSTYGALSYDLGGSSDSTYGTSYGAPYDSNYSSSGADYRF
ncbi:hypothetical protein V8F20_000375 [Naviculisporaceae sp. PSN 640]